MPPNNIYAGGTFVHAAIVFPGIFEQVPGMAVLYDADGHLPDRGLLKKA
jgi:hypothetical protein